MDKGKLIKFLSKSGLNADQISERLNTPKYVIYKVLRAVRLSDYRKSSKNALYNTQSYIDFRKSILERDKVCVKCQKSGSKTNPLQVDHFPYPKALYPDKIFDPNNARALCLSCHKKTETFGRSKLRKFAKKKQP